MTVAYVALGANLGDAEGSLRAVMQELSILPGIRLLKRSSLYRTAPVGLKHQPDFINAAVALDTELDSHALLRELFSIEQRFGRQRSVPNAPRTLDLDLLLYGEEVSDDSTLTLPHPRMHERAFVLVPLVEIAPGLGIPGKGSVADLLAQCQDQRIERMA
ncbi:MAG TPA: 2-amino-4-hydroxy-6-hydroxymethyldihydropteridine diphosphokinase [Rhodocyclaceae bacterium]|nr:2-amino-4-hydroxy-6-hydroxymethyldihydropteridine diphosphokinase [Rhodocyclaceae bacterium]